MRKDPEAVEVVAESITAVMSGIKGINDAWSKFPHALDDLRTAALEIAAAADLMYRIRHDEDIEEISDENDQ